MSPNTRLYVEGADAITTYVEGITIDPTTYVEGNDVITKLYDAKEPPMASPAESEESEDPYATIDATTPSLVS